MRASPTMLMKTHVEKMSVLLYATILMKINRLGVVCHDVDDKQDG